MSTQNWKTHLNYLSNASSEFNANAAKMSEYERQLVAAEIQNKRESWSGEIMSGCLGEYETKINGYRTARAKVREARNQEGAKWQADKLNAEIKLARDLYMTEIKLGDDGLGTKPPISSRVGVLFNDLAEATDEHKKRAALEAVRTLDVKGLPADERMVINRLQMQAEDKLKKLRRTKEITAAEEAEQTALKDLQTYRETIDATSRALNGRPADPVMPSGPLDKATRRLQIDQAGNVFIHDLNDPAVSGIFFRTENEDAGG
jgi:hypothetical protein